MKAVVSAVAFCLISQTTSANYLTGNNWMGACNSKAYAYLSDYLAGVVDSAEIMQRFEGAKPSVCVPVGVTTEQLSDIYCGFLIKAPAIRQEQASTLAIAALGLAFPCSPAASDDAGLPK